MTEPEATIPNGPAAAAILSAGIGSCTLAVLAVASDGSKTLTHWLSFYPPSGSLSGVTSVAVVVWLAAWLVLARLWRHRTVNFSRISVLSFVLLAIALLLTFPPLADRLLRK